MAAPAYLTSGAAEHIQDGSDDQEHDADGPEDRDPEKESQQHEEKAQRNQEITLRLGRYPRWDGLRYPSSGWRQGGSRGFRHFPTSQSHATIDTMGLTVIALGGNALLRRGDPLDPAIQDRNVEQAAASIVAAISDAEQLVITHGNGPQVGLLALADAARPGSLPFPLDVLGAESEGMIGYLLARHLHRRGGRQVAGLLTQVEVDRSDPAFARPTKPIGPTYGAQEAQQLAAQHGWEIAPEGPANVAQRWRRVVASPRPRAIVELESIRTLLATGAIVVCAGGGGVPVARVSDRLEGIEAVVDKDATSALLAEQLGADQLLLLTDVEAVVADWGTPQASPIGRTTPDALDPDRFAEGSMGPKVRSACGFVRRTGASAAIGSLERLSEVLAGRSGTWICPTDPASDP